MKVSNLALCAGLTVLLAACGGSARLTTVEDQRVFFNFDKYYIRPDAKQGLLAQAEFLRANEDIRVLLAGHCDERGTREYNLALGMRRANSAKQVLVANGVAANRIELISYGKDNPWTPGTGERVWALNRNVHTTIIR